MSEPLKKPAAIEIHDLHVELGRVPILTGVNARIRKGEITALIGPNGAGKTTLLLAILGMVPYRGRIEIPNGAGRPRIGYVPQHLEFDRGMPVTALDFLCLPRQRPPVWLRHSRRTREKALANLELVEAAHLSKRRLGILSGGELQRVLLAQALLDDPAIVLLDEPSSAVDRSGEELFMSLIKRLKKERNLTMLLVSHDLSMVTRLAGQVICLNRVVLSEGKAAEVLNEKTLSGCFGADKGLLLHDHPWGEDAEINCAYHPDQDHGDH